MLCCKSPSPILIIIDAVARFTERSLIPSLQRLRMSSETDAPLGRDFRGWRGLNQVLIRTRLSGGGSRRFMTRLSPCASCRDRSDQTVTGAPPPPAGHAGRQRRPVPRVRGRRASCSRPESAAGCRGRLRLARASPPARGSPGPVLVRTMRSFGWHFSSFRGFEASTRSLCAPNVCSQCVLPLCALGVCSVCSKRVLSVCALCACPRCVIPLCALSVCSLCHLSVPIPM